MVEKWTNRAMGTLSANITSGALSLTLNGGQGALFPSLDIGDYFWAKLEKGALYVPSQSEIIRCTARAGDVLTIERAQQGTTALAFDLGDRVELRLTRTMLEEMRDRFIPATHYLRLMPPHGFAGCRASVDDPYGIFGTALGGTVTLVTTSQLGGQSNARHASTTTTGGTRGFASDGFFRGNAAGLGGFRMEGKFGVDTNNNGCRMFVGLTDSTGAFVITTGNPSVSASALFGFGFDDTSLAASGNLRFYHSPTAGTPSDNDTGISRVAMTTNVIYYLIYATANASSIRIKLKDLTLGTTYDQTISTNIPSPTTILVHQLSVKGNGGANTARLNQCAMTGWPFPWAA